MVKNFERGNLLNSNFLNIKVNDLEGFLQKYLSIEKNCFTGKTS